MALGVTPTGPVGARTGFQCDINVNRKWTLLGSLGLVAGRGLMTRLQVHQDNLLWSVLAGTGQPAGVPLSVFQGLNGVSPLTYAYFPVTNREGSIQADIALDVAGEVGGMWGIDPLTPGIEAQVEAAAKAGLPVGRRNWLFGLGQVAVPAGATALLAARAARPGEGPLGELVLDIEGQPAVGDIQVTDILIGNQTVQQNARPIEGTLLEADSFVRGGCYQNTILEDNTIVQVEITNNSINPVLVSGCFISGPPIGSRAGFM